MDLEDNNTLLFAGSASGSEKLSCSSSKQHPCVHDRFKRGPACWKSVSEPLSPRIL